MESSRKWAWTQKAVDSGFRALAFVLPQLLVDESVFRAQRIVSGVSVTPGAECELTMAG